MRTPHDNFHAEQLSLTLGDLPPPTDADEPAVLSSAEYARAGRVLLPGSLTAGAPCYVTLDELAAHYAAELETLRASGAPAKWIVTIEREIAAELASARRWLSREAVARRASESAALSAQAAIIEAEQSAGPDVRQQKASA